MSSSGGVHSRPLTIVSLPQMGPWRGLGAASWKLSVSSPIMGFGLCLYVARTARIACQYAKYQIIETLWMICGQCHVLPTLI